MGAATASATLSARCKASDFGTSSPRITCRLVIMHKRHRDGDGMSVDRGMRHASDPALEQPRQNRLAQPAQGQAGNGDSQLHAVDDAAELLVKFEDGAGARAVGFDQLLDARFAHADQRELGCGEEGIGRHQEQDDEHPQQHVCNHGTLILTFQRDNRSALRICWRYNRTIASRAVAPGG